MAKPDNSFNGAQDRVNNNIKLAILVKFGGGCAKVSSGNRHGLQCKAYFYCRKSIVVTWILRQRAHKGPRNDGEKIIRSLYSFFLEFWEESIGVFIIMIQAIYFRAHG